MDSMAFNTVSVLKQEIETLEVCRNDKYNMEYQVVIRWLKNRVHDLENE